MMFHHTVLTPHLTRIEVPGDVYVHLVHGAERALLIDTGLGRGSLKAYAETLTDLPYTVILTHGHVDHAGGAGEFSEVGLHPADRDIALIQTKKDVRAGYLGSDEDLIDPPADDVFRTLMPGMVFDLGEERARIFALAGHTPGSVAVLLENERIMITGDALNSAAYLQLDHSLPLSEYRENLIAFREETEGLFDTLLYSHPHNKGGKEIVDQMIGLCEEIVTGITVGTRRPDVIGPNTYEAYPSGPDQMRLDGISANLMYNPDNL